MRYYSAQQERTGWSRAADGALVLGLILALPAAWVCDRQVSDVDTIHSVAGSLQVTAQGDYIARISDPEVRLGEDAFTAEENFWGFFRVDVDRLRRGFPLTTSHMTRAPVIGLTPRQDRPEFRDAQVDAGPGSAVYQAVREAIELSDQAEAKDIARYFENGDAGAIVEQNWGAWAASFSLWWVALFVASSLGVLLARLATFGFLRQKAVKEHSLAAQGRCPYCGYDLRGLEFSPRCPECGKLQD